MRNRPVRSLQVAGHETTGSVLTWTVDLLARNPDTMRKVGCCPWPVQDAGTARCMRMRCTHAPALRLPSIMFCVVL